MCNARARAEKKKDKEFRRSESATRVVRDRGPSYPTDSEGTRDGDDETILGETIRQDRKTLPPSDEIRFPWTSNLAAIDPDRHLAYDR